MGDHRGPPVSGSGDSKESSSHERSRPGDLADKALPCPSSPNIEDCRCQDKRVLDSRGNCVQASDSFRIDSHTEKQGPELYATLKESASGGTSCGKRADDCDSDAPSCGRVRQLEIEVTEALARANRAEEIVREQERNCEGMRQEILRLEGVCKQMRLQLDERKRADGAKEMGARSPALPNMSSSTHHPEGPDADEDENGDRSDPAYDLATTRSLTDFSPRGAQMPESSATPSGQPVRAQEGEGIRTDQTRSLTAISNHPIARSANEANGFTHAAAEGLGPNKTVITVRHELPCPIKKVNGLRLVIPPPLEEVGPRTATQPSGADMHAISETRGQRASTTAAAAAAVAGAAAAAQLSSYDGMFSGERMTPPPMSFTNDAARRVGVARVSRPESSPRELRGAEAASSSMCGTSANAPMMFKEDDRRTRGPQRSNGGNMTPCSPPELGFDGYDDVKCIEIPVGREDEGLLLGGGRVLHKLKEELGGTLEYRRSQGVVCVYGQQAGPRQAAACVRTALLLRDGTGEPQAEEYSLARLCMDDLLAECIALKGLGQAGGGPGRAHHWSDAQSSTAAPSPASTTDDDSSPRESAAPWSSGSAHGSTASSSSSSSSSSSNTPAASTGASGSVTPPASAAAAAAATAAAAAAAAAVSVASNLPDGEYPPETASLRIIGEKFGCVIDVAGEIAADAAAAAVSAASSAWNAGRIEASGLLRPVGSATPVGHQDVLIWGPTGAVSEAKDAVAALVSGSATAEVLIGTKRIQRRDRGFWVNCETLASGLEIDHKRGSAWVRGRPEAVEDGVRNFQNKLASLFPGDFLAVPMPRAALKDLANAKGLAQAAMESRADREVEDKGYGDEADGVELWADWPCSCVRLRGEPAVVRKAAKALYAALAKWNTLEVSVQVDRNIVTRLLSRSGRILAGISSNMGITLLVEREKGVLRGRARTEEDAKEANRVLKLKVAALSHRRSEQANNKNGSASSSGPSRGPLLSPGLSSTLSDRSGMSLGSDDSPDDRDKELTDPFDELQAFFAGGPKSEGNADGRGSTTSSKRSCVFDGVEDVPSSAGFSGNPGGKNTASTRNAGRGQGGQMRGGPARGRGGSSVAGSAGMVTKSSARAGHESHGHHIVHTNRRSIIIHRPVLSPSSGSAGSPAVTSSGLPFSSDDGSMRRPGSAGHHAFHLHATSPGPPMCLTSPMSSRQQPMPSARQQHQQHHVQQQQQQQHMQHFSSHHRPTPERRTTWSLVKDDQGHHARNHLNMNQQHQQHQQQHYHQGRQSQLLYASAHVGQNSSPRSDVGPSVAGAFDRQQPGHRGGAAANMYGGCRGDLGYAASSSHGVVSYVNERPLAAGGGGGGGAHGTTMVMGHEDQDRDMAPMHQGLVRWTSDPAVYPRHPSAVAYNPVRATVGGRMGGRSW